MGGTGEWRRRTADLVKASRSDLARRSGTGRGEGVPVEENGQLVGEGNLAVRARGVRERERVRVQLEVASMGLLERIEMEDGWLSSPPLRAMLFYREEAWEREC
jgi:hypothetical protein